MHIYAYLRIFTHIYAYLCISMHIYLRIFTHMTLASWACQMPFRGPRRQKVILRTKNSLLEAFSVPLLKMRFSRILASWARCWPAGLDRSIPGLILAIWGRSWLACPCLTWLRLTVPACPCVFTYACLRTPTHTSQSQKYRPYLVG